MAEKDTELMAQTLNVKVWVLGEWGSGVGQVAANTQTRVSARGQVQGHNDLQIFSFALLFIYGRTKEYSSPPSQQNIQKAKRESCS